MKALGGVLMINGFYKYSLTLVVALGASSLVLAVDAAPSLGTAAATPTAGAAGTPKANGVSPQQNHTDQSNLRNIDAARRHQRDLEIARLEKEKAQARADLQKAQAELAKLEAKRQEMFNKILAQRESVILKEIDKTQEMTEETRRAFIDFIEKQYPTLATDTTEGAPLSLNAASSPEKVSEIIAQYEARVQVAESLKADVSSAAQGMGSIATATAEGTASKPAEAAKPAATPTEEEIEAKEKKMEAAFKESLRTIFKNSVGSKKASAPVTPEKIVQHVNALRNLGSRQPAAENNIPKPIFHVDGTNNAAPGLQ
jgi:hypothetical protein